MVICEVGETLGGAEEQAAGSYGYIGFLLTAAIVWGCTNPFIRQGSRANSAKSISEIQKRQFASCGVWWWIWRNVCKLGSFMGTWQVFLPFVINQCGSVFFWMGLAHAPLRFAVPFTNALTFLFTTLTGAFLGETISRKHLCGMILVLTGIYFCTNDG
ncbi:transmembrane protein 234 homolog [Paramacrobiotus metropolitanus]|uniref:transmembrane protein 234 homolog n=1 Tax=Paramacrobiotus metropolitanus TaxID=2943436 RepID=UPI002445674E|nr:transmembrane protein 234 homolog [Paramacrobiotus metropolitanus]